MDVGRENARALSTEPGQLSAQPQKRGPRLRRRWRMLLFPIIFLPPAVLVGGMLYGAATGLLENVRRNMAVSEMVERQIERCQERGGLPDTRFYPDVICLDPMPRW